MGHVQKRNNLSRYTRRYIMRKTAGYDDDFANFELMQFTGLKDKNGKEIYEGDLIECYMTNGEKVYYEPQEVKFPEFCCKIWNETNCEVIGNIYEHPNLIKKLYE